MLWLKVLIIIVLIFTVILMYSLCRISALSDAIDEQNYILYKRNKENQSSNLTDLEKQVVDEVMKYHNSKISNDSNIKL